MLWPVGGQASESLPCRGGVHSLPGTGLRGGREGDLPSLPPRTHFKKLLEMPPPVRGGGVRWGVLLSCQRGLVPDSAREFPAGTLWDVAGPGEGRPGSIPDLPVGVGDGPGSRLPAAPPAARSSRLREKRRGFVWNFASTSVSAS